MSFWYPITKVVDFKREVYRRALTDLAPHLPLDKALAVQQGRDGNGAGRLNKQARGARKRRRRKSSAQRKGR